MSGTQLVLINQFGEESINQVQAAGTDYVGAAIAATSLLANNTGGAAKPTVVSFI